MSRFGRWVPIAAVVALLAAAMLAAAYANPSIDRLPPTGGSMRPPLTFGPELAATPAGAGDPGDASLVVPSWVGLVLGVLCAATVLFVLVLLVWMLLSNRLTGRSGTADIERSAPPTPTETARQVRAALDEGLADLDESDADPRRVVIACWVRLEQAAAAAGVARQVGDTSTDLVGRLLATASVSQGVLAAFAAVYREARFATHTVDVGMRDQARSALRQLRDELSAGAGERSEAAT